MERAKELSRCYSGRAVMALTGPCDDDLMIKGVYAGRTLPGVSALSPAWKAGVECCLSETPGPVTLLVQRQDRLSDANHIDVAAVPIVMYLTAFSSAAAGK
jgi:hypothetical protein